MGRVVIDSSAVAAALLRKIEPLAETVTEALYDERPELQSKYGEVGREKCLQDMRYNIEHLAAAADLDAPEMFREYTEWLSGLLRARHVATDDLLRSYQLMESVVHSWLPEAESVFIISVLQAGIDTLSGEVAR